MTRSVPTTESKDAQWIGLILAGIVCLLGGGVILGWYLKNPTLLQIHPSFAPMQFNAALGFVLSGAGLLGWELRKPRLLRTTGSLTGLVGLLTLIEYGFALNLGVDELFMKHDITVETSHAGRMAPNTALCFLLTGIGLASLSRLTDRKDSGRSTALLGALVTSLGAVAFFGYLSRLETAYGWGNLSRMALHTSAGFLIAGHALIWIAWRIAPKDETQMPHWGPYLPAAAGITVSVCIWQALLATEDRVIRHESRAAFVPLRNAFVHGVRERVLALERMARRWESGGGTERADWEQDAALYVRDYVGYQAIEWADAVNHVRWIVPRTGNEAAEGLDLGAEGDRRAALEAARNERKTTLSRPVKLIQGGMGLLAYVPLFVTDRFDGFILGVFESQSLFHALLENAGDHFAVEVGSGASVLYSDRNFTAERLQQWGHQESVELYGAAWNIRVAPTAGQIAALRSNLPLTALGVGLIGSLMLTGVVALMHRGRQQSRATDRANRRFRRVIESSPIGMLMVDHAGTISFANTRAEEIFDYTRGDLTGRSVDQLVPAAHRHGHAKRRHDFEGSGQARQMGFERELCGIRRDGSEVPVEIGLAPIETEEGRQMIASIVDVSQRREAEHRSRELTERLRLATENARIGVWDWNLITNESQWDKAMYDVYGIRPDDFTDTHEAWRAVLHPADRERVVAEVKAVLKTDQPFDSTFRARSPDGTVRHIQAFGLVQRNGSGEPVRMLGTNWDITEQKKAEELQQNIKAELESRVNERTAELNRVNGELRRHTTALENSNRDLEAFAYVASHDLQEPLRKIQAFGDILRGDLGDDVSEDAADSLETITSSAARMSKLIDALLVFSRVTHQALRDDAVDLDRVLGEVVEDLELPIQRLNAEIRVKPLGRVVGDGVQLRQLFQNLVGNSLNYFQADTPLIVEIWSEPAPESDHGQPSLLVHVRDNGKGFEQKYAEKIFQPFQRLEGRNSGRPGTGIGLAICRRIVERHRGTVGARGEAGKGAEILVTLPTYTENHEEIES